MVVIHDAPSDPEMFISKTCPVMGSNLIVPETPCTNTGLSSSQKDDVLLNAHEIIAVSAQKQKDNKLRSTLNAAAPNGSHHSATAVSDDSYYRDSLIPENMSDASNDD
ncbi:unnamed protein product [Schistosoma mattheei]|uniref:Uncharacterized protein n=1 Tax=Schistosoma mattheei TaxID=31246 RepID=A0A183P3C1_9TREM|nr:unnamed protein product [Schistosoma mattheei]